MQAQEFFEGFYDDKYLKVKVLLKISTTIIFNFSILNFGFNKTEFFLMHLMLKTANIKSNT